MLVRKKSLAYTQLPDMCVPVPVPSGSSILDLFGSETRAASEAFLFVMASD